MIARFRVLGLGSSGIGMDTVEAHVDADYIGPGDKLSCDFKVSARRDGARVDFPMTIEVELVED